MKNLIHSKIYFGISIILCGTMACIASHEFIIKKEPTKEKQVSYNNLKEQCASRIGNHVELSTTLVRRTAQIIECTAGLQSYDLKEMRQLLEGDKNSFFAQANKQQLQQLHEKLEKITHCLIELDAHIARHLNELATAVKEYQTCMQPSSSQIKNKK